MDSDGPITEESNIPETLSAPRRLALLVFCILAAIMIAASLL